MSELANMRQTPDKYRVTRLMSERPEIAHERTVLKAELQKVNEALKRLNDMADLWLELKRIFPTLAKTRQVK
jgi:hypothetical protein